MNFLKYIQVLAKLRIFVFLGIIACSTNIYGMKKSISDPVMQANHLLELGNRYYYGIDTDKDYDKAFKYYLTAAQQPANRLAQAHAWFKLGKMYHYVGKDYERASICYLTSKKHLLDIMDKTFKYYLKAAQQPDRLAQSHAWFELGKLYYYVGKDYKRANKCYLISKKYYLLAKGMDTTKTPPAIH